MDSDTPPPAAAPQLLALHLADHPGRTQPLVAFAAAEIATARVQWDGRHRAWSLLLSFRSQDATLTIYDGALEVWARLTGQPLTDEQRATLERTAAELRANDRQATPAPE